MRLRFTADFDWYPPELNGRSHVAYKAGMVVLVRKTCAAAAVEAGVAKQVTEKETSNGRNSE